MRGRHRGEGVEHDKCSVEQAAGICNLPKPPGPAPNIEPPPSPRRLPLCLLPDCLQWFSFVLMLLLADAGSQALTLSSQNSYVRCALKH